MDTERADHLTSYGYQRPTSPEIAKLALEATLFESAYSASSWTLPSHASMFTGRYLHEHLAGATGQRRGRGSPRKEYLDGRYPVLAEALRDRGYATGGFVANRYWTGRQAGISRGFLHYEDYYGNLGDAINRTVVGRRLGEEFRPKLGILDIPGRKRTDRINADLLDWLDAIGDRPFFAFLNYFDVHMPYLPPREVAGMFGGTLDSLEEDEAVGIGAFDENARMPSEAKLLRWLDRYDESLAFMDRHIGALLDSLERRGILDNTIVILTSDHGESFGEKGLLHHGTSLYLTELKVPLIVRYPARFRAGARVSVPVSTADIPATVARLTGVPAGSFPGQPLPDAENAGDSARIVLAEVAMRPTRSKDAPSARGWVKSLVTDRWQFLLEQSGRVELYDIRMDPAELHDVASAPENQALIADFRSRLAPLLLPGSDDSTRAGVGSAATEAGPMAARRAP
jgi:arylsulfatase A-like enzyme